MRWYILGERERWRNGQFITVAEARDELTATLVRDYLLEHQIDALMAPVSLVSQLWHFSPTVRVWVHIDDLQAAVELLQQLQVEWQEV